MDGTALAQRYFDGWNAHDADAIAAAFAPGGTYSDPTARDLDGPATGAYAAGIAAAFPDLRFEIVSLAATPDGRVAAEWVMRGTNAGSYAGLPPTGRAIELPGADFIRVSEAGIESIEGYFDAGVIPRQLGLDVVVQPRALGPWTFGVSSRASVGSDAVPGAISLTLLEARSDEEVAEVRARSREVVTALLDAPGFIAFVGAVVGRRMYTMTAWEAPEDARRIRSEPTHREAVARFFGPDVAMGGHTGVWVPERLNGQLVRCAGCGRMQRAGETCECGAALSAPPVFW